MSSPNPSQHMQSQIPTQFRAISRNNSNLSTASSCNRAEICSTISTANSITSSRSQLSRNPLIDHRQLLTSCGTSTPIRSFQRATISSKIKTRAFDNNPLLQNLQTASSLSGRESATNSQTPSPHLTPIFSRSRSLRMSGGPNRYQHSPVHYRNSSRTPELYSFNSGDISNESQAKLAELNNEKIELKESLEFLECERQVLLDTTRELRDSIHNERNIWKTEQEDLKRQVTDSIAARVKAESALTRTELLMNDLQINLKRFTDELATKDSQLKMFQRNVDTLQAECKELKSINGELTHMLTEKLKFNGTVSPDSCQDPNTKTNQAPFECASVVTEMARLRLEINEKDEIICTMRANNTNNDGSPKIPESARVNQFIDQIVECVRNWPVEIASSNHVKELMRTVLSAYQPNVEDLNNKVQSIHL